MNLMPGGTLGPASAVETLSSARLLEDFSGVVDDISRRASEVQIEQPKTVVLLTK